MVLVQRLLGLPHRPLARFLDWLGGVLGLAALLVSVATAVVLAFFGSSVEEDASTKRDAPAVVPVEQYIHEGGGTPARFPAPNGLFALTLGAPADRAVAQLGPEDERYAVEDMLSRRWSRGSMDITVTSDPVGAINDLVVTRYGAEPDDPWRVALPEGLVLGKVTVADVIRSRGVPHDFFERGFQEGDWSYDLRYQQGPEGTHYVTYTVISKASLGEELDPVRLPPPLMSHLITVYSITDVRPTE